MDDINRRIFEKYNPEAEKTRCPKGFSTIRDQLHEHAIAAVNLYGSIRKEDFVKIFNQYNDYPEGVTVDLMHKLLLPMILKKENFNYCFYKDFLVSYVMAADFSFVDDLDKAQRAHGERYVPDKNEFMRYINNYYSSDEQFDAWYRFRTYISDHWPKDNRKLEMFRELRNQAHFYVPFSVVSTTIEKYNLKFDNKAEENTFSDTVMNAINCTRTWSNNGYTPSELMKKILPNISDTSTSIRKRSSKHIGLNQSCPCGSGKKFRNCCYLIITNQKAILSSSEIELFSLVWLKLLNYVNNVRRIVKDSLPTKYVGEYDAEKFIPIRKELWLHPEIILDFTRQDITLTPVEKSLLKSWEKHHLKGHFIIMKHENENSIFMFHPENHMNPSLFAVKGITLSIPEIIPTYLPIIIETVLLPFGRKIIHDGYIHAHYNDLSVTFRNTCKEEYFAILKSSGITSSLTPF